MKTKVVILITSLLFIFSWIPVSSTNAATQIFSDVPKSYSYYDDIMYLLEKDIIKSANKYGVSDIVTREEVAVMVAKAVGLDGTPRATKFSDVPKSNPNSGYIQSAYEEGILGGYADGTFKPKNKVTRGQAAVFIANAFELPNGTKTFKDLKEGQTGYKQVKQLAAAGITSGYGDGTFKPDNHLTRAHISVFVASAIQFANGETKVSKQSTGKVYPDGWVAPTLQSKWAGSSWVYNNNLFEEELGFFDELGDGKADLVWGTPDVKEAITLKEDLYNREIELPIQVKGFYDTSSPYAYRIPVVLKEVFEYYFEEDADEVMDYLLSGNPPREFIANQRKVSVKFYSPTIEGSGNTILMLMEHKEPVKRTGKVYPDGWIAPVLQSKFISDERILHGILERELGFTEGGLVFKVGATDYIQVFDTSPNDNVEMTLRFSGWENEYAPESYRVPIVTKELFKLFFEKDAERVFNYFKRNDIPDDFTANGRTVHAYLDAVNGAVLLDVSYKK